MSDEFTKRKLQQLATKIRRCTKCSLCETRTNAVPGDGLADAKVMIIGEAPGRQEDESGHPFVGSAGKYLDQVLAGSGLHRSQLFITNIVKCRPPKNRVPKPDEISICTSTYLFKQIELIQPKLIFLLGGTALKTMLGLKKIETSRGQTIQHNGYNYLVTYHPAARFYNGSLAKRIDEDFAIFKEELKKIKSLKS